NVTSHQAFRTPGTANSASAATAQPARIQRSARGSSATARRTAAATATVATSQPRNHPTPVRVSGTKEAMPSAAASTAAGVTQFVAGAGPGQYRLRRPGGGGTG